MLDVDTLRVAEASVAACVFILVFFGTYRTTRAPFAGWWSAALLLSSASSIVYLIAGGSESVLAAACGNGLAVAGAALVWVAARSLRGLALRRWWLTAPGSVFAVATFAERPLGDAWPGGASLLVGMAGFLGLGALELWKLAASHRADAAHEWDENRDVSSAVMSMAIASSAMSGFYAFRAVAFVVAGPESAFYRTWAGPTFTTLLMTVVLVVVTYAVSGLTQLEEASRWRVRATRDDLTGVLLRSAFRERAEVQLGESAQEQAPAAIVADLDHFKSVNDEHGHAEGDRVLVAFARAMQKAVGPRDLVGRFGGEEFVVLLADGGEHRARAVARRVDAAFVRASGRFSAATTVSYGVAARLPDEGLDQLIHRADNALYRAKRAGRARIAVHGDAVESTVQATRRGGAEESASSPAP